MTKVLNAKSSTKEELNGILNPLVREWFFSKFVDFSPSQKYGVMNIHNKKYKF